MSDDLDVLAADRDREHVAAMLRKHYTDGRLTMSELDDRLAEVYAARTLRDLQPPLRQLPVIAPFPTAPRPPQPPPVATPQPAPPAVSGRNKGLREHLTSYVVVNTFLVLIWFFTSPGGYFWPIWPMMGWGVGVVLHAVNGPKQRYRPR